MKKFLLLLLFGVGFGLSAHAQRISKNAIGLRIGDNNGFGTELNYQLGLADNNRLELGLGWASKNDYNQFQIIGLYEWVWAIDGNFQWFAGPGGGVGQVNFDSGAPGNPDDDTYIFVGGTIGLEYNFDFPLLLSLDFRPILGFGEIRDDLDFDIALGVRYQF